MADVRALLRQQREARRVEHPHAAYSDAGKLLCTVCHEHIKTESLWDGHLRSINHRQRLQLKASGTPKGIGHSADRHTQNESRDGAGTQSLKRKLDEDVEMGDAGEQVLQEDNIRKKRSKPDMTLGDLSPPSKRGDKTSTYNNSTTANNHKPITPPLTRRHSGTPTLGVEMQIPSRPATPGAIPQSAGSSAGGSASTASTPKTAGPFTRSPLIPHDPSSLASSAAAAASAPISKPTQAATTTTTPPQTIQSTTTAPVDEDEWAAFEADLIHGTTASKPATNPKAIIASSAAISAPALSAEELAAKSEEEEQSKRRAAADIQIEDEREEATRALETEFEVMEELETRARKLRERREALRLRGGAGTSAGDATPTSVAKESSGGNGGLGSGLGVAVDKVAVAAVLGKENAPAEDDEDEEDQDDDEDEADDWVGFRFRS